MGRVTQPARTPLDAEALRAALGPRWSRVEVVAETASTNADLLADPGAPDRSVLVAENQVAGRGRLDRSWVSTPGAGLTFSVLVRPTAPVARWGWLPLLAGMALAEAVATTTGVATALKWPNDLLARPAGAGGDAAGKAAGILAQSAGDAVVVGIGLNVSTTQAELPVPTATSLALCGAAGTDRTDLLVALLSRLDARLAQWDDVAGDAAACGLADAYRAACATLGRDVAVSGVDGATVRGRAVDVDEHGRLVLQTPDGTRVVGAGDVEHVRPS